ncbi:DUF6093 family protein [Streptomyces gibsoniae]|uniref:DUF6093 family protein n=1 Tax=Streptomyces gibsoniae TaxID=3075529 RepID=A0ABU2U9P2_9ACTN|nr:DUF6093 family protein [Streptomyces sp. DSM 41699]MDT0469952.1 DUF6093 family protein [Streptomyces sp. DSM 41699]
MSSAISPASLAPVLSRIMVDIVQVFRPGPEVLDPDTGVYAPVPDIVVYEGLGALFAAVRELPGQPSSAYGVFQPGVLGFRAI